VVFGGQEYAADEASCCACNLNCCSEAPPATTGGYVGHGYERVLTDRSRQAFSVRPVGYSSVRRTQPLYVQKVVMQPVITYE
jgi:hypothetical protein